MARPKKATGGKPAEQRLVDALWTLLEANRLGEVTVGMVTAQAGVNRGTFYYHYTDLDDLLYRAIEGELAGERPVLRDVFGVITGSLATVEGMALVRERMRRVCLVIERGGMSAVDAKVKAVIVDMWRAVLCPDGAPLKPATRIVIEYAASGIIGLLGHLSTQDGDEGMDEGVQWFMEHASGFLLESIGEAQGVPMEVVLERIATIDRFPRFA